MESIAPSIMPSTSEDCRKIINNSNMIFMLIEMSKGLKKDMYGNHTITKSEFTKQLNELQDEIIKIKDCLDNGTTQFDIDRPGIGSSDGIDLTITITSEGGRRSKTRRTKKGKRKGRGRKTRQRK